MRITDQQHHAIKRLITEMIGDEAIVTLFGSRVDDSKRGGDVDLLVEVPDDIENPAWLAARIASKVSKMMLGRHVDILLSAPNLRQLPIHTQAKLTGIVL